MPGDGGNKDFRHSAQPLDDADSRAWEEVFRSILLRDASLEGLGGSRHSPRPFMERRQCFQTRISPDAGIRPPC